METPETTEAELSLEERKKRRRNIRTTLDPDEQSAIMEYISHLTAADIVLARNPSIIKYLKYIQDTKLGQSAL